MELIETPLACQTLYEGKIIRVERMDVRLSDGRVSKREIVRHSGGCAVVAVDAHGRIPLVEQYRMAIARTTLELPAGKVDAGEDALVCAQRELSEEGLEKVEVSGLIPLDVSSLPHKGTVA